MHPGHVRIVEIDCAVHGICGHCFDCNVQAGLAKPLGQALRSAVERQLLPPMERAIGEAFRQVRCSSGLCGLRPLALSHAPPAVARVDGSKAWVAHDLAATGNVSTVKPALVLGLVSGTDGHSRRFTSFSTQRSVCECLAIVIRCQVDATLAEGFREHTQAHVVPAAAAAAQLQACLEQVGLHYCPSAFCRTLKRMGTPGEYRGRYGFRGLRSILATGTPCCRPLQAQCAV